MVVVQSTPLSAVLDRLAVTLSVPRHRLLLLREEVELRADATVGALGLGIADIIGQLPTALRLKVLPLKAAPTAEGASLKVEELLPLY